CKGVVGVATCDKGLPAMMMALAAMRQLPCVLVPGGVTLPPEQGEDAGKIQTIGARFAHGQITLEEAAELGCKACASPGGGCQFLGTAATAQVVAEGLGMTLPHAALAPSGQPLWLDLARRSARALGHLSARGLTTRAILTPAAVGNAMAVHAACGVTEGMLHLRALGLLDLAALTASVQSLGRVLDWWQASDHRNRLRDLLATRDGIDPDTVIMSPAQARAHGLTATVTFPRGNL